MREATAGRLAGVGPLERALRIASFAPLGARVAAKTIYLRLRIERWVDARELPELIGALDVHAPVRHPVSKREAAMADAVVRRLLYLGKLRTTCLYRSLIRFHILRHEAELPVEFVMGVRDAGDGEITAHAWLELDGTPLWEVLEHAYETTYRYPPSRKAA